MDKKQDSNYPLKSSPEVFFFFSINFRVIRINMQILCPDRMYNLKNELILQIALFHFFVIFQAVYSNDSGICFLVLQQLLHCFFCISCCISELKVVLESGSLKLH